MWCPCDLAGEILYISTLISLTTLPGIMFIWYKLKAKKNR
jgi:hypothetical protein